MSTFPTVVKSSTGRVFHLAKEIGRGGEGAIYETKEQSDIALKIYLPNKAQSRRDKVSAMASAQWYKNNPFVAFPIDVLFSPSGAFVGFAMKKVGGHKPVHMLYSPASRKIQFHKANYPFLIRAALNISKAVAAVHGTGCVIGDVNHSGFLVSDRATSILIDSDSFQVAAGNNNFLCQVGTPEYTPPELQGGRFDRIKRTDNHDNFGLAVLIFQLVFMGRHPFSGKFLGSGEMPLERAIKEYRFAYSAQADTKMERPPGAPTLSDFPPYIGQAFETSFGRSGPQWRPTASNWVSMLEKLEGELERCATDGNHHHIKGRPCPWCRMEHANPGFIAFLSSQSATYIPTSVDVAQISAIISAIQDPGPIPNLQSVLNPTNITPTLPSRALSSKLRGRAIGGIAASAVGTVLIFFGGGALWPGILILGAGILCSVVIPPELKKLREERSQANSSWRVVQDAWAQQPGNKKFLEIKKEADGFIRAYGDMPNEERRGIQLLEQKKQEAQLYRHLDRFLIANAKIRKIGSGRKAVLASFGIETAADFDRRKISSIQGFGPSLVSELMAWRQAQVLKFVFNPSEPINPTDLAALRSKTATRRVDLDRRIRLSAANLRQESNVSLEQRRKILASANPAFFSLKQAELNETAATGPLYKASKFISLCCAGLAAIGLSLYTDYMSGPNKPTQNTLSQNTTSPKLSGAGSQGTSSAPSSAPRASNSPGPSNTPRVGPPSTGASPSPWNPPNVPRPSLTGPTQITPPTNAASVQNSSSTPPVSGHDETKSPPLPPPKEIPTLPRGSVDPPHEVAKIDLTRTEDAVRIQERLIALGFLAGTADGKWGPRSRAALVEFKRRENLPATDVLDDVTQTLLFKSNVAPYASGSALLNNPSYVGGWTTVAGECGRLPPVRITATGAEANGGACEFISVRQDGKDGWRVSAICSASGKSWPANIRLTVQGSELRWVSERPETIYYRCTS